MNKVIKNQLVGVIAVFISLDYIFTSNYFFCFERFSEHWLGSSEELGSIASTNIPDADAELDRGFIRG